MVYALSFNHDEFNLIYYYNFDFGYPAAGAVVIVVAVITTITKSVLEGSKI